jgi:hypothetical protein
VHEYIDGALRLKALDLWSRITGNAKPAKPSKEEHKHIHLTQEKLDELYRETEEPKGNGE